MILIPAIDIQGGKVVRLYKGRFDQVTEYGQDPLTFAKQWEEKGAKWLHLVDLDGAREGAMANRGIIAKIAQGVNIPVEVGGGIRTEETIQFLLEKAKVSRVILGTKAIEDREMLKRAIATYGEKICVSIDCQDGMVAGRGWLISTNIKGVDLAKELEELGLKWIVYTDIARDGTLTGPNWEELANVQNSVKMNVIASGGISKLDDVKRLVEMKIPAAITGKAIYEGRLDFEEALKVC